MNRLDERISDFSQSMRLIMERFQRLNGVASQGPHLDLSQQEIRLVEQLRLAGTQKMKGISEYLGVAVNSVTSIIDNLEKKGFVVRQRSQDDRRVVYVELTQSGRDAADASALGKRELLRTMLERLTDEEQETLVFLSKKIAASAVQKIESLEVS